MTTELATVIPYDLSRRWATAFRAHRFDGIRHQLRHDQRARPSGIALFGPAGTAQLDDGIRSPLTPPTSRPPVWVFCRHPFDGADRRAVMGARRRALRNRHYHVPHQSKLPSVSSSSIAEVNRAPMDTANRSGCISTGVRMLR